MKKENKPQSLFNTFFGYALFFCTGKSEINLNSGVARPKILGGY
jgi:hypothetical protein